MEIDIGDYRQIIGAILIGILLIMVASLIWDTIMVILG
jgi:hypothetical protein